MIVSCDVVRCKYNENFKCIAETVHIRLNHVNDSNGEDYTMIIECEQQKIINKLTKKRIIMIYKNLEGKTIDTDKEQVVCPWCHKTISKEDIDNGEVYHDGVSNSETREDWCELLHQSCAEEASEWRRDKYGY